MICSLVTLKVYSVHPKILIFHYCWFNYVSCQFFSCHYYSFEYISEALIFTKDTIDNLKFNWDFIVLCFLFHRLHDATTLRVLNSVLCFHIASFNYGAKDVRHVDPNCTCHQSNIKPDSIFSVKIARCITCVWTCLFAFCFDLCMYLGVILWTLYIRRDKVLSFPTMPLVGLRKP